MTVEPPSSGRPSGPPSGPLSGSSPPSSPGPPPPPPPGGTGAGGGAGGGTGPSGRGRRPWWRSAPGLGALVAAMAVALALAVLLTRTDGGSEAGGGEIFLQAANAAGPDPFTGSTAEDGSAPPTASAPPATGTPTAGSATESSPATAVRGVRGGEPGLYGGTRDVSSCDVEQQITYLRKVPAKNEAFASVAGVASSEIPSYLRSLTPLRLRLDTRVTNHGYRDGAATDYQAVLQAGTAVLVDDRGVPRVRCACGNPLTRPVEQADPRYTGTPWPGYSPSKVVVVDPAPRDVGKFVVRDTDGGWFERRQGDTGGRDRPAKPPDGQSPPPGDTPRSSPSPDTSRSAAPPTPDSTPDAGPTTGEGDPPGESPSSAPGDSGPTTGEPPSDPRTPPPAGSGTTDDAPDGTAGNGTGGTTGDAPGAATQG
ncbi:DUF6777 domain-containing protein [Streptomyces prasinus]|uniref:DUF6777 domain-containing protein n=1 Tax=Streptomyces prasinus TaxID=67345 RepID=UPI0036CD28C0